MVNTTPDAMGHLGLLAACLIAPVVWHFVAKRQRARGAWPILAHLLGAFLSFCSFFSAFAILAIRDFFSVVMVFFVGGMIYSSTWKKNVVTHDSAQLPSSPQPILPSPETIDEARRRSLATMHQATKARADDMARTGEKSANPLWVDEWHRNNPSDSDADGLSPGVPFTKIEFNYLGAKGDRSHRTVEVWAVDDEYFEGHCHKASSTRTFVIGRVRGKILVHDTGEILSPRRWATQARQNPLNFAQVQGRPN